MAENHGRTATSLLVTHLAARVVTLSTAKDGLSDVQATPREPITDQTTSTKRTTSNKRTTPRREYRQPSAPEFSVSGHNTHDHYKKNVAGTLQIAGAMMFPVAPADAAAVVMHSENISQSVADLAVSDSRIARILDRLLEIGPYGALISAVMPLAAQIMTNHGILKPGNFGAVTPEECIAQVVGETPVKENKANGHANTVPNNVPA